MSQSHSKLKIWINSTRPKTLWAAVGPVLIGTALAYCDTQIHMGIFLATLTAAVLIQIGTNLSNDYFDSVKGADTEERTGPLRATQAGLVSPVAMMRASIGVFGLAALLGLYLISKGGWPILVVGVLSILSGILYTAGPFPLGYLGMGEIFVLFFFGPVAVGGTYYLQTRAINPLIIMAGLAPGLISTAILAVNNLRDRRTDKTAGKKTLAVRLGRQFGIFEYIACVLLASFIPVVLCWITKEHYACLVALFALLTARKSIVAVYLKGDDAETCNQVLEETGKFLVVFSVLFSVGWIL
ncbi:MAG: 1,4-dihydroxy-2-naphthoate polyprenyltransferase [Anaerohalosphaeraceae bacterium]